MRKGINPTQNTCEPLRHSESKIVVKGSEGFDSVRVSTRKHRGFMEENG